MDQEEVMVAASLLGVLQSYLYTTILSFLVGDTLMQGAAGLAGELQMAIAVAKEPLRTLGVTNGGRIVVCLVERGMDEKQKTFWHWRRLR